MQRKRSLCSDPDATAVDEAAAERRSCDCWAGAAAAGWRPGVARCGSCGMMTVSVYMGWRPGVGRAAVPCSQSSTHINGQFQISGFYC